MKFYLQLFVLIIGFLSVFNLNLKAQEIVADKIILKTGEVYIGEILIQTPEIVLIKTTEGARFQFPVASVKSIEKGKFNKSEIVDKDSIDNHNNLLNENLCLLVDFSPGISKGKLSYPLSFVGDASLSFGTKKIFNETLFAGLGIGYYVVSVSSTSAMISYVPVYIRLQSYNLKKKRTAPYLSFDAGYAFSTDLNYGGGTFAKLSTGVIHKISYKMAVFGGLYARVQSFSGKLTETINSDEFIYKGNSSMLDLGAKIGFQF